MLPGLILLGLLFGRWWRTCLVLAAVAFPLLLLADGTIHLGLDVVISAALAAANTAVGVAVHQATRGLFRAARILDARRDARRA